VSSPSSMPNVFSQPGSGPSAEPTYLRDRSLDDSAPPDLALSVLVGSATNLAPKAETFAEVSVACERHGDATQRMSKQDHNCRCFADSTLCAGLV